MLRVAVSVEGYSEERFIQGLLTPHFVQKQIHIQPINMDGGVTLAKVKRELRRLLNNFDYVTTLYDFYGFKGKEPHETKESLEQRIATALDNPRLLPYIQMYELEGLLFSEPEAISTTLEGKNLKAWAEKTLHAFNNDPEKINDSAQTAPSKRLTEKANYMKGIHALAIAEKIGLPDLRKQCRHFDSWISQLEKLSIK